MSTMLKAFGILALSSGIAVAAEGYQNWPIKGTDEKDASVQAAYQEQCAKWAEDKAEAEKAEFVTNCMKRMPKLWPVGYAPEEAGG